MSSDKSKSSTQPQQTAPMSRRCLLRHSALVAGGVALTALSARRAQAQQKLSQADAEYQDSPNDGKTCADCTLFVAPSSCAVVEGDVSSSGWCKLYVAKA